MTIPSAKADSVRLTRAHVLPFGVFIGFLLIHQLVGPLIEWNHPAAPWWRRDPAQWLYPVQTLVTLGCLIHYRRSYDFHWSLKWNAWAVVFGIIGIGCWILPTMLHDHLGGATASWMKWFGVESRTEGFNPGIFNHPVASGLSLGLRVLRAVIVVAWVEEVFWRGFLMRCVSAWDGDCWSQPFGRFSWRSYGIVTCAFMLAHSPVDWAVAWIFGSLTYGLCVWSKSLGSCIVMHATANLLMAIYIMAFGKYGLW